jgi:hypothetical protein
MLNRAPTSDWVGRRQITFMVDPNLEESSWLEGLNLPTTHFLQDHLVLPNNC